VRPDLPARFWPWLEMLTSPPARDHVLVFMSKKSGERVECVRCGLKVWYLGCGLQAASKGSQLSEIRLAPQKEFLIDYPLVRNHSIIIDWVHRPRAMGVLIPFSSEPYVHLPRRNLEDF
jgi:hypothetical protein